MGHKNKYIDKSCKSAIRYSEREGKAKGTEGDLAIGAIYFYATGKVEA